MNIQPLHRGFKIPTKGTELAGAFDIYMPEGGYCIGNKPVMVNLGFAAEVPVGYVALLLPRSGCGAKHGVELFNTCGVIDSDYRGPWIAAIRTKNGQAHSWNMHDRLIQVLFVPVLAPEFTVVSELSITERGAGGFGSTSKV